MRRPGFAIAVAVAAALCLLGGIYGAGSAVADHNGAVQLSVGGRAFTSVPTGPLVDTGALAPGVGVGAGFGVRSGFGVNTGLSLQLTHVHDDDNGCARPEAALDNGCGAGQGELGGVLRVVVASAATRDGTFVPVWTGSATQLLTATPVGIDVPARGERWIRLELAVPARVGNIVESDSFRFGLSVVLQGNGVRGGSGVDATGVHRGDGQEGHQRGRRACRHRCVDGAVRRGRHPAPRGRRDAGTGVAAPELRTALSGG